MNRAIEEYNCTIENLSLLVHLYRGGEKSACRLIALELRRLLCDHIDGEDKSLLTQVFSGLRIRPLFWARHYSSHPELFTPDGWFLPGQAISAANGAKKIELLMDVESEPITPDEWVRQPFCDPAITVQRFLDFVSEFDTIGMPAGFAPAVTTWSPSFNHPESRGELTAALGELILAVLKNCEPPVLNGLPPDNAGASIAPCL